MIVAETKDLFIKARRIVYGDPRPRFNEMGIEAEQTSTSQQAYRLAVSKARQNTRSCRNFRLNGNFL